MITHVALVTPDGVIYSAAKPARHDRVVHEYAATHAHPVPAGSVQGFLDHEGNFLSRTEARFHVHDCEQECKTTFSPYLFSEDIW